MFCFSQFLYCFYSCSTVQIHRSNETTRFCSCLPLKGNISSMVCVADLFVWRCTAAVLLSLTRSLQLCSSCWIVVRSARTLTLRRVWLYLVCFFPPLTFYFFNLVSYSNFNSKLILTRIWNQRYATLFHACRTPQVFDAIPHSYLSFSCFFLINRLEVELRTETNRNKR